VYVTFLMWIDFRIKLLMLRHQIMNDSIYLHMHQIIFILGILIMILGQVQVQ